MKRGVPAALPPDGAAQVDSLRLGHGTGDSADGTANQGTSRDIAASNGTHRRAGAGTDKAAGDSAVSRVMAARREGDSQAG
jgi:hypothetical protein